MTNETGKFSSEKQNRTRIYIGECDFIDALISCFFRLQEKTINK